MYSSLEGDKMRKLVIFLLVLVLLFSLTQADYKPLVSLEEVVNRANEQIGYEYYDINKINKSVYERYGALVYGKEHGDKKGNEYRYLGYTPGNDEESFNNPIFPRDAWAGGYLDDRNWVKAPWNEGLCKENRFDGKEEYEDAIIYELENNYVDEYKGTFKDWYKYMHILQPPTDYAPGLGCMWHIDSVGKKWYFAMNIPSLKSSSQELIKEPEPIPHNEEVNIINNKDIQKQDFIVYTNKFLEMEKSPSKDGIKKDNYKLYLVCCYSQHVRYEGLNGFLYCPYIPQNDEKLEYDFEFTTQKYRKPKWNSNFNDSVKVGDEKKYNIKVKVTKNKPYTIVPLEFELEGFEFIEIKRPLTEFYGKVPMASAYYAYNSRTTNTYSLPVKHLKNDPIMQDAYYNFQYKEVYEKYCDYFK